MNLISSLSSIFLVAAMIINILMAVIVYRVNSESSTNKLFAWLCVLMSFWMMIMVLAVSPSLVDLSLLMSRLSFFLSTPMDVAFFLLAVTLPRDYIPLKKWQLEILCGVAVLIMLLAISPYTFTNINLTNGTIGFVPGFGLPFVGGFNCLLVIGSAIVLTKRFRASSGVQREQFRSMILGIALMFGLVISTIFLPLLFFNYGGLISLAPLYTLCFLGLSAYAIVKQHLFNLKIIATQALIIGVGVVLFAEMLADPNTTQKIVTTILLLIVILFGKYLIGSVKREIEQREKLEVLDKELSAANEQLKTLDTARAEFISIASHQLRTPPSTIKWFLASVLGGDYGPIPDELRPILEKTNRTNNSQISLIEDMLNVSRIERGKMEFLFEAADMLELANITVEQLEPIAKERGLVLMFDRPENKLPIILADKEKIRQVMNNLIDNALKYTKEGSVLVTLSSTPDVITFSVKDTGKGIAPEEMGVIFEKFSRGKESIKQSAGLGLGLYVAKVVVEQHKGKIWAESEGLGKGTTFIFTLPIKSGLEKTSLVDFGGTK